MEQGQTQWLVAIPAQRSPLTEHLLAYVNLLRGHSDKENDVLFGMADTILSPANQDELCKAFDAIEAEEVGEGVHEQYHQFAHELMKHCA